MTLTTSKMELFRSKSRNNDIISAIQASECHYDEGKPNIMTLTPSKM